MECTVETGLGGNRSDPLTRELTQHWRSAVVCYKSDKGKSFDQIEMIQLLIVMIRTMHEDVQFID